MDVASSGGNKINLRTSNNPYMDVVSFMRDANNGKYNGMLIGEVFEKVVVQGGSWASGNLVGVNPLSYKGQLVSAQIEYNPFQRITSVINVTPHKSYDKASNMLKIRRWAVELRLTTTTNALGGSRPIKPAGVLLRFNRNQLDFMNATLDYIYCNTNSLIW